MTTIRIWSGREIRALREARRMSQRDFAAHLGISERMVAKWEAGGEKINPRPVNQSALDSSLAAASPDVQVRFSELLDLVRQAHTEPGTDDGYSDGSPPAITGHQVRHPIDGKLMTLVEAGVISMAMLMNQCSFRLSTWTFSLRLMPTMRVL